MEIKDMEKERAKEQAKRSELNRSVVANYGLLKGRGPKRNPPAPVAPPQLGQATGSDALPFLKPLAPVLDIRSGKAISS